MIPALIPGEHGAQFLMRWIGPPIPERRLVESSDDVKSIWKEFVAPADWFDASKEAVVIVAVNHLYHFIGWHLVSIGSCNGADANIREILRAALRMDAYSLALVHNHPSGQTTPSRPDKAVTRNLVKACRAVNVRLLDHVVVNSEGTNASSIFANNPEIFEDEPDVFEVSKEPPPPVFSVVADAILVNVKLPARFISDYQQHKVDGVLFGSLEGMESSEWVQRWNTGHFKRAVKQARSRKNMKTRSFILSRADFDEVSLAASETGEPPDLLIAAILIEREWQINWTLKSPAKAAADSAPSNILQFRR